MEIDESMIDKELAADISKNTNKIIMIGEGILTLISAGFTIKSIAEGNPNKAVKIGSLSTIFGLATADRYKRYKEEK